MNQDKKNILVIGVAGGLAKILCKHILQSNPHWNIIGVDSRDTSEIKPNPRFKVFKIRYSRGYFENIFRDHQIDTVIHLARVTHSNQSQKALKERLNLNLMGTKKILELCQRHAVQSVIVLSTFHVYGALSDNSVFLDEESPLRASLTYPDLRDVVEMDQICTNWMWKNQNDIRTVILRPCNIIGPNIHNAITEFLKQKVNIKPVDYNPIFQFIYEWDMVRVLYEAITHLPTGVYNVASNETISLKEALELSSAPLVPTSLFVLQRLNSVFNRFSGVPEYLFDYLKYSCLINNRTLLKELGSDFFHFPIKKSLQLINN